MILCILGRIGVGLILVGVFRSFALHNIYTIKAVIPILILKGDCVYLRKPKVRCLSSPSNSCISISPSELRRPGRGLLMPERDGRGPNRLCGSFFLSSPLPKTSWVLVIYERARNSYLPRDRGVVLGAFQGAYCHYS